MHLLRAKFLFPTSLSFGNRFTALFWYRDDFFKILQKKEYCIKRSNPANPFIWNIVNLVRFSRIFSMKLNNLIRHIFFRQGWRLLNPYWRKFSPTKMCLVRYIPKKIRLKLHVTELKNIRVYERRWNLTYFSPILHFYTSGTCHRVKGFLTFSESLEM